MQTFADFFATQLTRPTVLTIGSFDGVHRGHQKLLRAVMERARELNAASAVITLHPHPKVVLGRDPNLQFISTLDERLVLLASLGLDEVIVYPFDESTSHLVARDFVQQLVERIKMVEIVCTRDFGFGYKRQGNVALLQERGRALGFGVAIVEPETNDSEKISSTRIRELVAQGQVARAARLLGRFPSVRGVIVEGDHRGRLLGFPTANLELPPRKLYPANGIYATRVSLGEANVEWLPSATSVGVRPTFYDQGRRLIETHILDFNRDIYGQTIQVEFVERLRDELKFDGIDSLVAQMKQDCAQARTILAKGREPFTANSKTFEEIDHTADWAFRAYGSDVRELFVNAARAMFALQGSLTDAPPMLTRPVMVEGMDRETLLVNWLNELLYLQETQRETYDRFEINELTETTLRAQIQGKPRGQISKVIKAATFHNLAIRQTNESWEATIVVDV